jgi:hypothetical protein
MYPQIAQPFPVSRLFVAGEPLFIAKLHENAGANPFRLFTP